MNLKVVQCYSKNKVYCYYCDEDMTPDDGQQINGYFDCKPCHTRFICSGNFSNPDIEYIHFTVDSYLIELNYDRNQTFLFHKDESPMRRLHMMELAYIADINPTNAKYWLTKLLNLKAFS